MTEATDNTLIPSTELLRVPKQTRSRMKFNSILDTTLKLIHQKGYEQVSVREIARDCDLPIASIYQYFPNKLSIVRQLWERYTQTLSAFLKEEFMQLVAEPTADRLHRVTTNIVDHMDAYHRENPEFLDIWRCVDSSPELRALNREDTLDVARAIAMVVCQVDPAADPDLAFHRSIIACETANHTVQLAQELPEAMREGVIESLKSVLISLFDHLAEQK